MHYFTVVIMNTIRLLLLFTFFAHTLSAQPVINAKDYGLDASKDATPAILKALKACYDQNASKLVIPKGTYLFYPDKALEKYVHISNNDDGLKRIAFPIYDFNGLEIDGQGSLFIMHGEMLAVNIDGSQNITLKNFSIDWNKPFNFQGEVVAINPQTNSFDLKVYDECDYEIVANELVFVEKPGKAVRTWRQWPLPTKKDLGWEQNLDWNIWYDPVTMAGALNGGGNHILRSYNESLQVRYHVEEVEKNLLRFYNAAAQLPKIGWVLILKGKKDLNRLSPGIHLFNSDDIRLENVNVHHSGGMALIGERSGNIFMENFNVKLREGSGRLISATADATHFVSCRGVISFNNCLFENMLDDATNVHGIYTTVDGLVDEYTLGVKRMHGQQMGFLFATPGDSISFSHHASLFPYAKLQVQRVYEPNEEYMEITFTEKVSDLIRPNTVLNNITWQPDLQFKNSTVRRNRARSILISTAGDVLVEGNHFETSTSTSIHISGDGTFWYESGPVRNVLIRNNHFKDMSLQGTSPVVRIDPQIVFAAEPTHYYHKSIVVENNTFELFKDYLVYAFSVRDFQFRNNTIVKSNDYEFEKVNNSMEFRYSKDIHIEGNVYNGPGELFIMYDQWVEGVNSRNNKGFAK